MLIVAGQNTRRDSGRKVQLENINAGKVITCQINLLIILFQFNSGILIHNTAVCAVLIRF